MHPLGVSFPHPLNPPTSQTIRMNRAEECSFCLSKFVGRQHRHTEGWYSSMVDFVEEESGLVLPNYMLK